MTLKSRMVLLEALASSPSPVLSNALSTQHVVCLVFTPQVLWFPSPAGRDGCADCAVQGCSSATQFLHIGCLALFKGSPTVVGEGEWVGIFRARVGRLTP